MANFRDKITVTIDFLTDGAQRGLAGIRTKIGEADGAMGKLKAGAGAAFASMQQYAGQFAIAAGAAVVGFGVKAVGAFTDSALAAGKFADATGLTNEQASQWLSVADDLGASGDVLQAAFLKMNRELSAGGPLLEELGISAVKAADGTTDVNATMLQAIDVVGRIPDATKRAEAAQKLFGRSYAEVAEIVLGDADRIREALESTSEAQVFDDDEVQKARDYRAALDNLGDVATDLTNNFGEMLTPAVTDFLEALKDVVDTANALKVPEILSKAAEWSNPIGHIERFTGAIDTLGESIGGWFSGEADKASDATTELVEDFGGLERITWAAADAVAGVSTKVDEARQEAEDAAAAVAELEQQWADLKGELSDQEAFLNLADQFDNLEAKAIEAYVATAEGSADAERKARDHERAMIDLKERIIDYAREVLELPPEQVTEIMAQLDEGNIADVERRLANLARNRTMTVTGVVGSLGSNIARYSGGPVPGPKDAPVPILAHGGEFVLSADQVDAIKRGGTTRGLPTGSVQAGAGMVINIQTAADPNAVVDAIRTWQRRNGAI